MEQNTHVNCALTLHTASLQAEQHLHPRPPLTLGAHGLSCGVLLPAPCSGVTLHEPLPHLWASLPALECPRWCFSCLFSQVCSPSRHFFSSPVPSLAFPSLRRACPAPSLLFSLTGTPCSSLSPQSLTSISANTQSHLLASATSFLPLPQDQPQATHWGWAAEAPPSASGFSPSSSWCCPPGPEGSQSGHRARSSRPGRISPL